MFWLRLRIQIVFMLGQAHQIDTELWSSSHKVKLVGKPVSFTELFYEVSKYGFTVDCNSCTGSNTRQLLDAIVISTDSLNYKGYWIIPNMSLISASDRLIRVAM